MGNPGSNINVCLGEYIFLKILLPLPISLLQKLDLPFFFPAGLSLVIWKLIKVLAKAMVPCPFNCMTPLLKCTGMQLPLLWPPDQVTMLMWSSL